MINFQFFLVTRTNIFALNGQTWTWTERSFFENSVCIVHTYKSLYCTYVEVKVHTLIQCPRKKALHLHKYLCQNIRMKKKANIAFFSLIPKITTIFLISRILLARSCRQKRVCTDYWKVAEICSVNLQISHFLFPPSWCQATTPYGHQNYANYF